MMVLRLQLMLFIGIYLQSYLYLLHFWRKMYNQILCSGFFFKFGNGVASINLVSYSPVLLIRPYKIYQLLGVYYNEELLIRQSIYRISTTKLERFPHRTHIEFCSRKLYSFSNSILYLF
ncbi:hypothetical protein I3843_16G012100 [Carya illinoinensis]|nr:hypothetical protein I3843_16G012100 [Carya illinoinensis]